VDPGQLRGLGLRIIGDDQRQADAQLQLAGPLARVAAQAAQELLGQGPFRQHHVALRQFHLGHRRDRGKDESVRFLGRQAQHAVAAARHQDLGPAREARRDARLRERRLDHRDRVPQPREAGFRVRRDDAPRLRHRDARAEADLQPAAAHLVQCRQFPGDRARVPQARVEHERAHTQRRRRPRDRGEGEQRRQRAGQGQVRHDERVEAGALTPHRGVDDRFDVPENRAGQPEAETTLDISHRTTVLALRRHPGLPGGHRRHGRQPVRAEPAGRPT
jgi:hypothetical protein